VLDVGEVEVESSVLQPGLFAGPLERCLATQTVLTPVAAPLQLICSQLKEQSTLVL
jgi:hypothetical protein